MQLHELKPNKKRTTKKRVGRGGTRGKTSGHGHKGQKQHGRHGIRPQERDWIKKIPKRRGYGKNRAKTVNSSRVVYMPVNLTTLEEVYSSGDTVSFATLLERGIAKLRGNKPVPVKILARGEITKKLTIENLAISASAKEKIEKAGGEVKTQ